MRKNIVGKRYGLLVVLEYTKTLNKRPYWKCQCDCGIITEKRGKELKSGLIKSCGCLLKERGPDKDLTGQKFNYLTIIKCIGKKRNRSGYWWECKCDCGNITKAPINKILSGWKKSCGCLSKQKSSDRAIQRNKNQFGNNNPNWKENLTDQERNERKNIRIHSDLKLKRWRIKVYTRDGFCCVKCKKTSEGDLNAHHIYSWHSHKKLRYVTNNGITLCKDCHKDFHHKYGNKNNTKKQLKDFLNNMNFEIKLTSKEKIDIREIVERKLTHDGVICGGSLTLKNGNKFIITVNDYKMINDLIDQYEVNIGTWNNKKFETWIPKNIYGTKEAFQEMIKQRDEQTKD